MSSHTKKRSLVVTVEPDFTEKLQPNLDRFEQVYVAGCLDRSEGNITKAALWAGIDRNAFRRRARKYGLI